MSSWRLTPRASIPSRCRTWRCLRPRALWLCRAGNGLEKPSSIRRFANGSAGHRAIMHVHIPWIANALVLVDLLLRVGLSLRVIMRRLPVGVSLAWLSIIFVLPYVGAVLYLLVGEYRLGPGRGRRAVAYQNTQRGDSIVDGARIDLTAMDGQGGALARLCQATIEAPPLGGNSIQLLENADAAFPVLLAEIDRAQRTCFVETYIWSNGGRADDVVAALCRAQGRGVDCRVLVDSFGSGRFLKSPRARELRQAGGRGEAALPSGPLRFLFVRPDLRMHRNIM